jgi:hypothetical protein
MTRSGRTSSDHIQAPAAGGGFDYRFAPREARELIQEAAKTIRAHLQAAEPNAAEFAGEVRTVKRLLGHGTFLAWLEAEFGLAGAEADRFIVAAYTVRHR